MIRSIIERTGVKIDVEDDGRVNVASADEASAHKAIGIIQELTATPELNKTYMGKVQRITDFGAFVEIMPGLDGLLHVSEIAHYRVKDVRDELKEGDQVMVKVINIDPPARFGSAARRCSRPKRARRRRGRRGSRRAAAGRATRASRRRRSRPRTAAWRSPGPGAGSESNVDLEMAELATVWSRPRLTSKARTRGRRRY